jgi:hypothetical protein
MRIVSYTLYIIHMRVFLHGELFAKSLLLELGISYRIARPSGRALYIYIYIYMIDDVKTEMRHEPSNRTAEDPGAGCSCWRGDATVISN